MKAVRIHTHGKADVIQIDDLPLPTPNTYQCIVNIKSAALNHLDLWVRRGIPGIPLPMIMGSDGAGVITEIGDDVKNFNVGDSVLIQPLTYCGDCKWCNQGKENYCNDWGIFGENQDGTQCEYMAVDEDHLRLMPNGMTFNEAAAFPLVAETAYAMLVDRAQIQTNETVFVWGASSGVGSMAIQIAKAFGCHVVTTVGDEEKREFAEILGADLVINYKGESIADIVKDYTKRNGVDVVVEHVGTESWKTSLRILGKGGKVVTCGATTGEKAEFDIRHLFSKQQSILGSTMGSVSSLDKMLELYKEGKVKPIVDRVFNLQDARLAHEYLESGNQIGKVILNT